MSITFSNYDLQTLLAHPFKQKSGKNRLGILAGVFLSSFLIPILPLFLVAGYLGVIIRRIVSEDGEFELPPWDEMGAYFSLGLKLNGAAFIYMLPVVLLIVGGYIFMMFPVFSDAFSPGYGYMSDAEVLSQMGAMFGGFAIVGLGILLSLPLSFIVPVAGIHLIAEDRFAAAFDVKKWWQIIGANLSGFFVSFVLSFGLYFVAVFLAQIFYMTLVLCILIPVILSAAFAYLGVISSAVFGIAYKNGVENLAGE